MSVLRRILRADQRDRETEAATGIRRTVPQATSRDDADRLEEERVYWLRKKRRGRG